MEWPKEGNRLKSVENHNPFEFAQRLLRCDGFGCPNWDQYVTNVFDRKRIDADVAEVGLVGVELISSDRACTDFRGFGVGYGQRHGEAKSER